MDAWFICTFARHGSSTRRSLSPYGPHGDEGSTCPSGPCVMALMGCVASGRICLNIRPPNGSASPGTASEGPPSEFASDLHRRTAVAVTARL